MRAQILLIIGEVENSKEIHLTDPERVALAIDLQQTGFSVTEIRRMGEAVKRINTFGKLSIDVWLTGVELFTHAEARRMALQIIEQRKRQLQNMKLSEEEIQKEGMEDVQAVYVGRRQMILERVVEELRGRCKRVEAFIRVADESTRLEVLEIALKKSVLVKDKFWRDILPLCAPHLLDEVEPMILRMRGN